MDRDTCGPRYLLKNGACEGPFFFSGADCLKSENVFLNYTDCRSAAAGVELDYNPLDDALRDDTDNPEYTRIEPNAHQKHPTNHCVTLVEKVRGWRDDTTMLKSWCSERLGGFVDACQKPRPLAPDDLATSGGQRCLRFLERAP